MEKKKIKSSDLPRGIKIWSSKELSLLDTVRTKLLNLYQAHGYRNIITPIFESREVLSQGLEKGRLARSFTFSDNRGELLILRPDVTVPIARMVGTQKDPVPLRYCYWSHIYRQNAPLRASLRQVLQSGVECFGGEIKAANLEILRLAKKACDTLNLPSLRIDLGHASFLEQLFQSYEISDPQEISRLIGWLKLRDHSALKTWSEKKGMKLFSRLPWLCSEDGKDVIEQCGNLLKEDGRTPPRCLDEIYHLWSSMSSNDSSVRFGMDLGLLKPMPYYTGLLMEGYLNDSIKPVLSGGRYDDLTRHFGRNLPAVGYCFHIDALLDSITNQSSFQMPEEVVLGWVDRVQNENSLALEKELAQFPLVLETILHRIEEEDKSHWEQQKESGRKKAFLYAEAEGIVLIDKNGRKNWTWKEADAGKIKEYIFST